MTLEKRNAAFVAFWDCDGHRLCPEIVCQVAIEFAECCSEVLCVLWAAGALAQEAFSCRISTKVANRAVRHADGEGVSVREGNSKPQATKQGPSAQLSLAIGVERVRSTVRKLKGKLAWHALLSQVLRAALSRPARQSRVLCECLVGVARLVIVA